jgi:hypothetical protein
MPDETPAQQQRGTQQDWRPIPDPTVLTTEALTRGLQAERDYVHGQVSILEERLRGMDRANELLNETVNRVPTALQTAIAHERELHDQKFKAVDERITATANAATSAVSAAFAAQEKLSNQQRDANRESLAKAEAATKEAIDKNAASADQARGALSDKLDDIKERLTMLEARLVAVEARRQVTTENTAEKRAGAAALYAAVGFVVSLILAALVIIPVLARN